MMKNLILVISTLFIILISFQNVIGQNSILVKGKVIDYDTNENLPSVKIKTYNGKVLLNKTDTNLEDGSFTLTTKNTTDKILFTSDYYYPIIIENINKINGNELNIGQIQLIEIPNVFTRYISKKAEREGRREEKKKFKELKEGIIVHSNNRTYKMRLKKNKGEFTFYIDFKDFINN